jgi:Fe-S cluster biogenesis protein NfuA
MKFTNEDLFVAVKNTLENRVKPALALDGGGIELISVENFTVTVKLKGSCVGCPSSSNTLRNTVEKTLRSYIHPELEVIEIKG